MTVERRDALRRAGWLLVLVPVIDLVLAATGVIPVRTAVVVGLVLECLFGFVVVAEAVAFRAAYRAQRVEGGDRFRAALAGVDRALPRPVAFVVRSELGMVRSLWWALRRRRSVASGEVALPYTERIAVVLWAAGGISVLEVVVLHLLIPWSAVRWVVLALGLYGMVWVVGLGLSLRQHPHTLGSESLTLRFGHFRTVCVPLSRVAAVTEQSRLGHKRNLELSGDRLAMSVMGETNVHLMLEPGTEVVLDGRLVTPAGVSFFAGNGRATARRLREYTAGRRQAG